MTGEMEGGELARLLRERVAAVLNAVHGSSVEELRLEVAGSSISIRRSWQDALPTAEPEGASAQRSPLSRLAVPGRAEVRAQVVGVYHRARALDAPPLAAEGDRVESGAALGVIETLGIANDVLAPVAGRLAELVVQDGQPVEYGELLAVILPE